MWHIVVYKYTGRYTYKCIVHMCMHLCPVRRAVIHTIRSKLHDAQCQEMSFLLHLEEEA